MSSFTNAFDNKKVTFLNYGTSMIHTGCSALRCGAVRRRSDRAARQPQRTGQQRIRCEWSFRQVVQQQVTYRSLFTKQYKLVADNVAIRSGTI